MRLDLFIPLGIDRADVAINGDATSSVASPFMATPKLDDAQGSSTIFGMTGSGNISSHTIESGLAWMTLP